MANTSPLPAWPCLRPDARLIAPPLRPLRLALAPRHVVSIEDPPDGLAEWIAGLDGLSPLDEALDRAPVPSTVAAQLLRELDRAAMLLDANSGRPFRGPSEQAAALHLASQARAADRAKGAAPVRVWVRGSEPWRTRLEAALDPCSGIVRTTNGTPADLMAIACAPFDAALDQSADLARDLDLPHTAVVVSAVDAVLTPLLLPGRAACHRCWSEQTEGAGDDWDAWQFGRRTVDRPRLPAHQLELVIGLAVEHLLLCAEALRGRLPLAAAGLERRLDLLHANVTLRRIGAHPGCPCQAEAEQAVPA